MRTLAGASRQLRRAAKALRGRTDWDIPAGAYCEDGLATVRNHDFMKDPRFREALEFSWGGENETRFGHHAPWNFHVSLWAASHALRLPS